MNQTPVGEKAKLARREADLDAYNETRPTKNLKTGKLTYPSPKTPIEEMSQKAQKKQDSKNLAKVAKKKLGM